MRRYLSEFFFVAAITAFVWLFLAAGVYNAIALQPPEMRSTSQERIVRILSVLEDGDQSIAVPHDVRYTATLVGVPLVLAAGGLALRLWKRR